MRILRIGFTLGAVFIAIVGAANAQQQVVKMGYGPFAAPLTFLAGGTTENYRTLDPKGALAQGAMIDVMNAIAKDAGLQFQYVASSGADRAADITMHVIDTSITAAPQPPTTLTALLDFGTPIYNNGDGMVVLKSDTKQYTSWDDLKGEVVGVQKNTAADGAAQMSGLFKEVKVYSDSNAAGKAVSTGEIKAYLTTNGAAAAYSYNPATSTPEAAALGLRFVTTYKPRFPSVNTLAVAKGDTQLLAKLNASFAKLKADGTIKTIFAKWGIDSLLIN